jgi:hypothetical protein
MFGNGGLYDQHDEMEFEFLKYLDNVGRFVGLSLDSCGVVVSRRDGNARLYGADHGFMDCIVMMISSMKWRASPQTPQFNMLGMMWNLIPQFIGDFPDFG